ncbi:hypothetical protein MMC22_007176 [Lobaria immixta]|nr:hypothetical protein [Lobaria immixta]
MPKLLGLATSVWNNLGWRKRSVEFLVRIEVVLELHTVIHEVVHHTTLDLTTRDLTTADLTTWDLSTRDLTTRDLTPDLSTADLTTRDLTTADLTTRDLTTADLTTRDLSTADLTTPDFSTADLTTRDLTKVDLIAVGLPAELSRMAAITTVEGVLLRDVLAWDQDPDMDLADTMTSRAGLARCRRFGNIKNTKDGVFRSYGGGRLGLRVMVFSRYHEMFFFLRCGRLHGPTSLKE